VSVRVRGRRVPQGGPRARRIGSLPLFSSPRCCAAGSDVGGIDGNQIPFDLTLPVQLRQQCLADALPGAVLRPAIEPVIDRLPGADARGRIVPAYRARQRRC